MLVIFASLVIAVWFYISADKLRKSKQGWLILGLLSYFIPYFTWEFFYRTVFVPKNFLNDQALFDHYLQNSFWINLVGMLFGIVCAALVHKFLLNDLVERNSN